jgi:phosphoribosylformylglycinamidine cyclo-ligase
LALAPVFELIQSESGTDWKEMYKVLNCGTRLEVYVDERNAANVIDIARSFDIDAQVIGHVESSDNNEVLLKAPQGTFIYH